MSDMIEILDTNDVEDIVREWIGNNIYDYTPSETDIEGLAEQAIESEMMYGSAGGRIDNLESETMDFEERIQRLEGLDHDDWKLLEERVADLERKNEKLLDTLAQFAQLLTHRDLI